MDCTVVLTRLVFCSCTPRLNKTNISNMLTQYTEEYTTMPSSQSTHKHTGQGGAVFSRLVRRTGCIPADPSAPGPVQGLQQETVQAGKGVV